MPTAARPSLHPRNRHQGRYDFAQLLAHCPELAAHTTRTPVGDTSIDFGNPVAVRLLNRALLASQYGIAHWNIPDGYLCPPVPGRADYVHGLADLLAHDNAGHIPRGSTVRALDIGTGASLIYPLIGHHEYGWSFVGTDIDPAALVSAESILQANPPLGAHVHLRQQVQRGKLFAGVVDEHERFELTLCNPPFHASAEEAARGSERKWQGLGKRSQRAPTLNFGGQPNELWCTGGEASFLRRMANESREVADRVLWFTSLVSKAETLSALRRQLARLGARQVDVVPMAQGNKQSRFIAWTFVDAETRAAWLKELGPAR